MSIWLKTARYQNPIPAGDNRIGTKGQNENHDYIHAKLHQGAVKSQNTFRSCKVRAHIFRRRIKFFCS